MNARDYLLRNAVVQIGKTPLGIAVICMAELATETSLSSSSTGEQVLKHLEEATQPMAAVVLAKTLPEEPPLPPVVNHMSNRFKNVMIAIVVVCALLMCMFLTGIVGWEYFSNDKEPSIYTVAILVGVPFAMLMLFMGMSSDSMTRAAIAVAEARRAQSSQTPR